MNNSFNEIDNKISVVLRVTNNIFDVNSLCFLCWFALQDVLKKGSGGWRKVVAAFGDDILLENGEVDRAKLGQIVFTDPAKRQLLNRYSNDK